jgi:hypothetical protein
MPGETKMNRRAIGAISTLVIGVVGAVVTRALEGAPAWISTAFLIVAGVAGAVWAVESYYGPRLAALSRTRALHSSSSEDDDGDLHQRSRFAKQHDVALLLSVLAGGVLGMIIGVVLNGGAR